MIRILLTFNLLFLLALGAQAQVTGLMYELDIAREFRNQPVAAHLDSTGFRLAFPDDEIRLYVNSPYHLGQAMRSLGKLQIVHKHVNVTLRPRALRNQLRAAYLENFKWKSPQFMRNRKRQFNRIWQGREEDLNTRRAVWITLPVQDQPVLDWHIRFQKGRRRVAELTFNEELSIPIDHTPFVREHRCRQANRWTYFLTDNPATPRKIPPIPDFEPDTLQSSRLIFSMSFPSNSVTPDPDVLAKIRAFLRSDGRPVDRVYIHGMASVEGDSAFNISLTRQRAQILVNTLNQSASLEIPYKVRLQENWRMFEAQIRKEGWESRSRTEWKELLENDSVRQALEPWLARQRSARIMIYMKESVPQPVLKRNLVAQFKSAYARYARRNDGMGLRSLLAMRRYVLDQVMEGTWPATSLDDFTGDDRSPFALYAVIDQEEQGNGAEGMLALLENAWQFGLKAHRIKDKSAFSDLLYLQKVLFSYLDQHPVPEDILERFPIPDGDKFLRMQLNYLAYREKQRNQFYAARDMQTRQVAWSNEPGVEETRYYLLLKQVAQETLSRGLRAVAHRSDWIREFDLAEFLEISLYGWDPVTNTYLDPEIGRKEIGKLLNQLIRDHKNLCEDDVTYLRLTYALKLIQAGSVQTLTDPIMHQSINFAVKYYARVAPYLSARDRIDLANQLISANSYLFFNEAWYLSQWLLYWEQIKLRQAT